MRSIVRWIKSKSSMRKKFNSSLFVDMVNHLPVFLYVDCYKELWMAQDKWGFRIPYE